MTTLDIQINLPGNLSMSDTAAQLISIAEKDGYSLCPDEEGAIRAHLPTESECEFRRFSSIEDLDDCSSPKSIHFSLAFDRDNPYSRIDVGVFRGDGNVSERVNLCVPQGVMWAEPNDDDFAVGKKHYQFAKRIHCELLADISKATGDNEDKPQFQFGGKCETLSPIFES